MTQQTKTMLNDLAEQQVKLIDFTTKQENSAIIDEIAGRYLSGKMLFTGIGKCSFLAMKQAATLKSIGLDAEYLDAVTAMHGDLGGIAENASLLCLSKSGLSQELFQLIQCLAFFRPDCKIYLVTMGNVNSDAYNAQVADYSSLGITIITLPCFDVKELDGYGIVPSISNALFEIFLSIIASVIPMSTEQILTRLQKAHPGGSLQSKVQKILSELTTNSGK
jgi:arabinose-5-phosphate isomerase